MFVLWQLEKTKTYQTNHGPVTWGLILLTPLFEPPSTSKYFIFCERISSSRTKWGVGWCKPYCPAGYPGESWLLLWKWDATNCIDPRCGQKKNPCKSRQRIWSRWRKGGDLNGACVGWLRWLPTFTWDKWDEPACQDTIWHSMVI